ncbi:MAG TPA: DUF5655 domain-containing protein [Planctomycetota bacterium]|jgi:hypothetical protein|nr:DUF5655 domain-containing protein [Planctomycetota bacterium]
MKRTIYSPHPSIAYAQAIVASMKVKSGRTLEEWIAFVRKSGPATEEARRMWLQEKHGLGMNYSWWIAARTVGKGEEDTDPEKYLEAAERYVEEMFAGSKAGLRPIYEKLLETAFSIAEDVKVCPCQTIVPIFRRHVIAQIKPSTRTRIDFGLALGKRSGKLPKRLIDTGGAAKKDRITHRIEVTSVDDLDGDLVRWLKTAYDLDA